MSDNHSATDAFDELIKAGKFTYISPAFWPQNDSRWTNKGTVAASEFYVLNMGRNYSESDVDPALQRASQLLNRPLRFATAVDLPGFAALGLKNSKSPSDNSDQNGWNGSDTVVAFGSSYAAPDDSRFVPWLWNDGDKRRLVLSWAVNLWFERDLVLCVFE